MNLGSARQSQIEGSAAPGLTEEHHSQIGKGDDEDRFGKVAASPNSKFQPDRSISEEGFFRPTIDVSVQESVVVYNQSKKN